MPKGQQIELRGIAQSCILPVFTVKQRARPAIWWSKSTLKDMRSKLSGRHQ
jgi:hypothetical protein